VFPTSRLTIFKILTNLPELVPILLLVVVVCLLTFGPDRSIFVQFWFFQFHREFLKSFELPWDSGQPLRSTQSITAAYVARFDGLCSDLTEFIFIRKCNLN